MKYFLLEAFTTIHFPGCSYLNGFSFLLGAVQGASLVRTWFYTSSLFLSVGEFNVCRIAITTLKIFSFDLFLEFQISKSIWSPDIFTSKVLYETLNGTFLLSHLPLHQSVHSVNSGWVLAAKNWGGFLIFLISQIHFISKPCLLQNTAFCPFLLPLPQLFGSYVILLLL